jgi:hypothetical protein
MPAAKRKIDWFDKGSNGLNEIYQQTGMVFSFLSSPKTGSKQCHEWVKCRDYLHDAVRTTITGNNSAIYGFRFNKGENPDVDLRKMRMLVSKNNLTSKAAEDKFRKKSKHGLLMLNHFEKQAKVALSKMVEVDATGSKKKVVFLYTGSVMWMKSPFLVSMYTFLIRLGDKELKFNNSAELKNEMKRLVDEQKKSRTKHDNDVTYLGQMWNRLHNIIKYRKELFPMEKGVHNIYFRNTSIGTFHNNGGILSLANGNTPDPELNNLVKKIIHTKE